MVSKSSLRDLDEWVYHQHEQEGREGITLDDAVCQFYLADIILLPVLKGDLPSSRHLDYEHLDAMWEAIDIRELFQKGVVDVVVRLLEVIVEFDNISLLFLLHPIRGQILDHRLLASLRCSYTSLFVFEDAPLDVPEEPPPHTLVDG